ncbi:MAG: AAA family ATPase [Desulfovibrio sp.]|nr:AAA family ATPase [Desulfovibrio sp.]
MSRQLTPGTQSFEYLRQNNYFYVDKTKFIKDWWNSGINVTLITRPRRFGKTLMLDTVKTFFSPKFIGRSDLFEGLDVWKDEQFRNIQGKIPVIFLSFAKIDNDTYEETISRIKTTLASIYGSFTQYIDIDAIPLAEKEIFTSVHKSMTDDTAQDSLNYLCKFIATQHKIKPIILLDEYDTPLTEAWLNGYWDKLVGFLKGFFKATFKDNTWLERGLITGITRVAKESIFSGMNNLKVVSVKSDLYADCFGFTEQEVFAAMDEYGLQDKDTVKKWYNGFIFGTHKEIYNPWSIIEYLLEKRFDPYWAQTSSNSLVGELIARGDEKVKQEVESLLQGKEIVTPIDEQIVFSQLYDDSQSVWSLLLAAGYVKATGYNDETRKYTITLTNYESKLILEEKISEWFRKVSKKRNSFQEALLNDNLEEMNEYMNEIAESTFSSFDIGKNTAENFYHAFVLGLMVDLKEKYNIRSNQSSGFGRYDICMFPKYKGDRGIVIEFKVFKEKKEKNLQETCANALKQIKEKHYINDLIQHEVSSDNIYVYGFAFKGKEVLICGGAEEK